MKQDLLQYMESRSKKLNKDIELGGPLVTISREKGCPGNSIADKLAKALRNKGKQDWRWVNKEIIEESAKELDSRKQQQMVLQQKIEEAEVRNQMWSIDVSPQRLFNWYL